METANLANQLIIRRNRPGTSLKVSEFGVKLVKYDLPA